MDSNARISDAWHGEHDPKNVSGAFGLQFIRVSFSLTTARFRRRSSKTSREESEVHLELGLVNLYRKEIWNLAIRSMMNFFCWSEPV